MQFTRRTFFYLNLFTLIGFSSIGLAAVYFFQHKTPQAFFNEDCPLHIQLLRGGYFGVTALFVTILCVKTPWLKTARIFFTGLVASINPAIIHIFFFSLCTAIGEEILFRGAVQYHLGIWFTSIIVITLHGYINPFKPSMLLNGVLMIVMGAGLGLLYERYGIYAAIFAHFIFDAGMFLFYRWNIGKE